MLSKKRLFSKKMPEKSQYGRKYFSLLLAAFTILAFATVVSTTFVLTGMFMKDISDQLYTDYKYSLTRLGNEFDNIFIQMSQTYISLKQNSDINAFLTTVDEDYNSISRADIFLNSMKNLNTYLDSVILYNKYNEIPITAGIQHLPTRMNIDIHDFTNRKLTHFNTRSDLNMVASLMNPDITASQKPLRTVSVIYTDFADGDDFTNAIIMSIDPREINKKLLENYDGVTYIADQSGLLVFYPYNYEGGDSIADMGFFREIASSSQMKNIFKMKVDGSDKIVTFTKSYKTGFYIINLKPFTNYAAALRSRWITILLTGLIIILFFIISGYFVSKRIYRPIKKVTEMFSRSGFGGGGSKGEIDYISSIYERTIDHLKELEDRSKGVSTRLKEESLKLILCSNTIPEKVKQEIAGCDLKIEFSNLILTSLAIDNCNSIDDDRLLVYETTLCKIIPDLISKDFNSEIINMYNGEIALLLNFNNMSRNNFDLLVYNMDKIRNICRETLQITLTVGIGSVANKPEECCKAYAKACEMVKHRFVLGFDKTVYDRYLEENLTSNLYYPIELEDQIISAIRANKSDFFEKHLRDLTDLLSNYPYSEAVTFIFQIIMTCLRTFNQMTIQDNRKYSMRLDEFSNTFSKFQTLDQVREWLLGIFRDYRQMIDGICQLKNSKHYNQICRMQEYIKQNYQNINLSADSIAAVIGYSPYYFTKIFKDMTGMNINDYIRQVRIEKVKELLSLSDCKINEIPAMTGFTNPSHFFAVFKKDVGLTPSAYREYILNSAVNDKARKGDEKRDSSPIPG